MAVHMSVRLAWHSDGWNGHICKKPCENSYCVGRYSYPGDLIASTRDLEFECAHAGEACSTLPCKAACGLSVNAFGKDPIVVQVDPPSFWKAKSASAIRMTLPPSTVCTWCYEEMYKDDVVPGGNTARKYDNDKRKEGAQRYFAQFEPGKSLIFYSAGYSNPFCEDEDNNYVVVGISRIKEIGPLYYYDDVSDEIRERYAGGLVWQRPVTSTYPDEGFCIPYWKYMDDEDILNRLVLKPQNKSPFKYGSREVSNDDAIEVINQLIAVVDTLIEIGDTTEDWTSRRKWLNSILAEVWSARGPYPGFAAALECLGLGRLIPPYIALASEEAMKAYRASTKALLRGETDHILDVSIPDAELRKVRREHQLLGTETTDFILETLSRFHIRAGQMKSIIDERRENVSITASIAEMQENPYIIFEQYIGYDCEDTIPLYKIENGILPSPEYGIEALFDPGATERLRAFCVDELNRIAAHSFGKAEAVLQAVNARLDRLPKWKQYTFKMQNFNVDRDVLDKALVQRRDEEDTLYLYKRETYEDERTVERTLRDLADRPDIRLKMAITPETFKTRLRKRGSLLEERAPEQYEEILDHQAEICMKLFTKPLCVLSGAAGTGKTTVIKAILDNIERAHGIGASFLLMAPTGKATERIKMQTGKQALTIHSYLARNGWINANFTLKRRGGQRSQDVNTIIIDECSMIDLNLFATLLRAVNWNSVQRLILIGDPNQLPPIGRGKVFADTIEWLNERYCGNVGALTDNIRQLGNTVEDRGHGILELADIFIQENQQVGDAGKATELKAKKEALFERILEHGNGDVDQDLSVYFWDEQKDLEEALTRVMIQDMQSCTGLEIDTETGDKDKLWQAMIRDRNNRANTEMIQVISPYRGEFYGTEALNLLMQRTFNSRWSKKQLDGIGYYDKVIQIRNRPQSDLAYAYQESSRKNVKVEVFNGEMGLSRVHGLDACPSGGKGPKYKWQGSIERLQVLFSGESRQGLRYNFGRNLGRDADGRWIPEQKVLDNLELAYAISVHKSQGSEFDYVYIVIPRRESHLLSMELLYTAITRAQKKVTIFLQQDLDTLVRLSDTEKSAVRRIHSSIFRFAPPSYHLLYTGSRWYEAGKQIATLSQYFVRSKSEAIIANLLVDREIPFKYEEPLYAPDGTMYLPDFTVKFRGEEYYWEHVGLVNDPSYMAHWAKKEAWYKRNFPGRLLITYESNNLTKDAAELIARYM